jgi:hypothetical protein
MDAQNQVAMGSMAQINTAAAGNLYTNNTNVNMQGYQQMPQQGYPQQPQMGTKQCPQCGAMLDAGEMFCGECGFKF